MVKKLVQVIPLADTEARIYNRVSLIQVPIFFLLHQCKDVLFIFVFPILPRAFLCMYVTVN